MSDFESIIIELGAKAKAFIESDLGKFIVQEAQREINEFKDELANPNLEDMNEIRLIRMEILARFESIKWLTNAIQLADATYLQQQQEDD